MDRKDYIKGKLANSRVVTCPRCDKTALTDGRIIVCSNCGVIELKVRK